MKNNKSTLEKNKKMALHYIKSFSEMAREPFLILDLNLKVIGANKSFYNNFLVTKENTVDKLVYNLGNGQWNIPELKKLLENILPGKKVFDNFEVSWKFPKIGVKIMLLNARRFDSTNMILLAIEDVTLKKAIETKLANYTKNLEEGIAEKTEELNIRIDELSKLNKVMVGRELKMIELKKEIVDLKKTKKPRK